MSDPVRGGPPAPDAPTADGLLALAEREFRSMASDDPIAVYNRPAALRSAAQFVAHARALLAAGTPQPTDANAIRREMADAIRAKLKAHRATLSDLKLDDEAGGICDAINIVRETERDLAFAALDRRAVVPPPPDTATPTLPAGRFLPPSTWGTHNGIPMGRSLRSTHEAVLPPPDTAAAPTDPCGAPDICGNCFAVTYANCCHFPCDPIHREANRQGLVRRLRAPAPATDDAPTERRGAGRPHALGRRTRMSETTTNDAELAEIRRRVFYDDPNHDRDPRGEPEDYAPWPQEYADRVALLAEVDRLRALLAAGTPQPTEEPKAQTVAELRAGLARYGMRLAVLPADTAPATTRTDPTNQRCPICAGTGWVREAKPGEYVEID
jgi:hypothetical protein